MPTPHPADRDSVPQTDSKFLKPRDISIIEEALQKVGTFGEVHLVIEHGRLRYVRTLKSEAIDNLKPA